MRAPPKFVKGLVNKALRVFKKPPVRKADDSFVPKGHPQHAAWQKYINNEGPRPNVGFGKPPVAERIPTAQKVEPAKAKPIPTAKTPDKLGRIPRTKSTYGVHAVTPPTTHPPRQPKHDEPPPRGPRVHNVNLINGGTGPVAQHVEGEPEPRVKRSTGILADIAGGIGMFGGMFGSAEGPMGDMAPQITPGNPQQQIMPEPMYASPSAANIATVQTFWYL